MGTARIGVPGYAAARVRRVEAEGWTGMGIVDSQCLSGDPYVAAALAGAATSRLKLATAVTNTATRHPAVAATAAASVQAEIGGRFVLGIGRGDSALAYIGLAPAPPAQFARVAEWARAHDVVVASDECYAEFAPEPATVLAAGTDRMLAVHSLSKRSNAAGLRVGYYAGDADLVHYLVETRKHAGLMVPSAVQAAAVAALGDDTHVAEQRERYRERRALVVDRLARHGLVDDGGPMAFYAWMRATDDADGWAVARRLAEHAGMLVSPGDLYGPAGASHARVALVQPRERFELAFDRLARAAS